MAGQGQNLIGTLSQYLPEFLDPMAIIAVVGGLLAAYQWTHRKQNTIRIAAFKKLHFDAKQIIRNHRDEGIFFREDQTRPKGFSSEMTLTDVDTGWHYTDRIPHFYGSYLIIGEAGCGKSEILKNDFYKCYRRQSWRRWFYTRSCVYYLDAEDILELIHGQGIQQKQELLERIRIADLNKLILYMDGVDELSDNNMERLQQLLNEFKNQVNTLILRFTCRTEFAKKHFWERHFDCRFTIEAWSLRQLQSLSEQILKCTESSFPSRVRETREYVYSNEVSWSFISSPLLLKLLLYIKIYGQNDIQLEPNRYAFYSAFFRTVISVYRSRIGQGGYDIETEIDRAAETVFYTCKQGKKTVPYIASLGPLTKRRPGADSNYVGLAHETFYEYLTARYYHLQFQGEKLSTAAVDVMSMTYSNDYADFITDAFLADRETEQIDAMNRMYWLYGYTLAQWSKEEFFGRVMAKNSRDGKLDACVRQLSSAVDKEQNPFLTLKYEIIFRFGRFSPEVDVDRRLEFLKFVYEKDDNIGAVKDQDYFSAVLKRCCAISASFLGGEEIELDYVRRMLDFGDYQDSYNENYDLANRSHTLVYYSDVPDSNIYTFRDNPAENPWFSARTKRLERLAFPLPNDITQMTPRERKKYCFRVFDIATIYTFLHSRQRWALSPEECRILEEFKIHFAGMSNARRTLLQDIKEETLRLIRSQSPV